LLSGPDVVIPYKIICGIADGKNGKAEKKGLVVELFWEIFARNNPPEPKDINY
jgi:hypothetical protein